METETKTKQATAYVVLRAVKGPSDAEGIYYTEIARVEAAGAAAARQQAFEKLEAEDQRGGATLIAVPARSWQPKRRSLVSTPRSVEE